MSRGLLQAVLGEDWQRLAPAVRDHYLPPAEGQLRYEGRMEHVHHSWYTKLLLPFCRIVGALVPYRGRDVPVTLTNEWASDGDGMHWLRLFTFPRRKPYLFQSVMQRGRGRQLIEFLRFGMGVRLRVDVENGALIFRDQGYVWRLGRWLVWLPVAWLLGRATIEERGIAEDRIAVSMVIKHPLFGVTFSYRGELQRMGDNADGVERP